MEGSLFCVRAVVSERFHSGYFTLSFCRSRERNVQKVLVTLAVTIFLLRPVIIIWSNRRSVLRHHAINCEYYFFPLAQSWYDIGTISLVFGWFQKGIYCPLFRVELIVFVMDLSLLSNYNLCQSLLSVLKPGKMISQRKKKKIVFLFCFLVLFW